jgi:hypothetical protein
MKATPELRYYETYEYIGCGDFEWHTRLQQKWEPDLYDAVGTKPEWIDVPTVRREKHHD